MTARSTRRVDAYPQNEVRGLHRTVDGRQRSSLAHATILQATLVMLRDVGYQKLTIEGVAAAAGASKATIYRWWPSKPALVADALSSQLQGPVQPSGDAKRVVRTMVLGLVEILDGPLGRVLPILAQELGDPFAGQPLAGLLAALRANDTATLLRLVEEGVLPADIDTDTMLDSLAGAILYRRLLDRPVDVAFVDQLTRLVLEGELPRRRAVVPSQALPTT